MRIVAAHDGSGCAYYRMIVPLRELARHGHDVTFAEQYKDPTGKLLRDSAEWDVYVAQRFTTYASLGDWRGARRPANRLVYENDDNVLSVNQENWVSYNLYSKPEVREAVQAHAEAADLVTVTVEPLAEVFREFNSSVTVLPNCVPAAAFTAAAAPREYRKLRVGWVGGTSHSRDIHTATPAVRKFIRRFRHWELYVGGADYRASFELPLDRMHFEPWHHVLDDEDAYYRSLDFDIGIAPLVNSRFSQSKSAIKAVEYGARGIPVVASDAGPYSSYIKHGYNGFLAKTDHEWLKYLSLLASDPALRTQMGDNGRTVAEEYSIERKWELWESAYAEMFGVTG